jgi:hypothetical protein
MGGRGLGVRSWKWKPKRERCQRGRQAELSISELYRPIPAKETAETAPTTPVEPTTSPIPFPPSLPVFIADHTVQ